MKRFNVPRLACTPLFAVFLAACSQNEIAAPDVTPSFAIAEAKATSPGYSVTELGTLPGDVESNAWRVNNAGYVAVQSTYYSMTEPRTARWYIRANGQNTMLNSVIYGLSNGAVTYVAGVSSSVPTLWTFNPSTGFSAPTLLDPPDGPNGAPNAVNDTGDVIGSGSYPSAAVIWKADGTRIEIPNVNTELYASANGRDINSTGDAAVQFNSNSGQHRGYVRTSDGVMIELPPLAGHVSTIARGVSDVIAGSIYVAGTSDDRNNNYRAVRWTIDLASHSITGTQVLADRSYSSAMADDGTIAGDISSNSGTTGFVWKGNSVITLKVPKGSSSGSTLSISGNGRYVSGSAKYGSYRKAVYWTAQ